MYNLVICSQRSMGLKTFFFISKKFIFRPTSKKLFFITILLKNNEQNFSCFYQVITSISANNTSFYLKLQSFSFFISLTKQSTESDLQWWRRCSINCTLYHRDHTDREISRRLPSFSNLYAGSSQELYRDFDESATEVYRLLRSQERERESERRPMWRIGWG